ncbi:MAG TPA: glycerophosphodiester phosphodiesterase family protein [Spirochaetota bacterium]|nr:glycerophosphodiester phosphodiesterase family protein [Spirochaetota bacterium]
MVRNVGIVIVTVIIIAILTDAMITILARPQLGRKACNAANIPYKTVIAHRGASYWAPEESYYAYMIAKEVGAEYLEMDVQRTKDNVLIAFHDDTLMRITNVSSVFPGRENDPIESFTIAELKKLDLGKWFNNTYPDRSKKSYNETKILTLDEVIDIAKADGTIYPLYIETKSPDNYPGIEQELVTILATRGYITANTNTNHLYAPIIFQSFEIKSLMLLSQLAPGVPRVYLIDEDMVNDKGWDVIIEEAKKAGCSGLGPSGYLGWPWLIGKAHRNGLCVHIYTVDRKWQFRLLHWFGADGFFTNRCELLMDYYDKAHKKSFKDVIVSIK